MTNEIEHSTPNHEKHQCNYILISRVLYKCNNFYYKHQYLRFCTNQIVGESNTEKTANILSVMNI